MDKDLKAKIGKLEKTAYAPYDRIKNPTREDWQKSYDALLEIHRLDPEDCFAPNTLGYLCYYGRHTGEPDYQEAQKWFELGSKGGSIESDYKLADLLMSGKGGTKDPEKALRLYENVYWYCRKQFEAGEEGGKFADAALRIARIFHEGEVVHRNDLEAWAYLLEAEYALKCRKKYQEYGDDTVMDHIHQLMEECGDPTESLQNPHFVVIGLGRPPFFLLDGEHQMTFTIRADIPNVIRLEFRRKRPDGKKPRRILWTVPQMKKTMLTDAIVLYGFGQSRIWNKNPGEPVLCDRTEYDQKTDTRTYFLNDEPQCRLTGGDYILPMIEFVLTDLQGSIDATGGKVQ